VFESRMFRAAAIALALGFAANAQAADVTGAGASFIYPVMSKWSADYAKASGKQVNYQSIGSGGGIAQIKAGTVDFGSSDAPLTPEELAKFGLAQFPSVIGGVVPVINVPGVPSGALKLDGALLADIFLGKVKAWDDPRIVALNGGVKLPSKKITVVHRSDGSGTTFNFVNYLSKVSGDWKAKVGEGTSVKWPTGIGGKGNEGVAAYVKQIKGGIGYVELSYALQNKMAYARLKNAAGNYVLPSDETFSAAAAALSYARAREETFPVVCVRDVPFAKPPYAALNALRAILGAAGADAFIDLHAHANDEAGNACARAILEPLLRRTPPPPAAPGLRLSHR